MVQTILRRPEVQRATGLPTSTLYRKMAEGTFPKPIKLSGRAVGWIADEIANWQQQRIDARGNVHVDG